MLVVEHSGAKDTHYFRDVGNGFTVIILTNRDYKPGMAPSVLARKVASIVNAAAELDWRIPF